MTMPHDPEDLERSLRAVEDVLRRTMRAPQAAGLHGTTPAARAPTQDLRRAHRLANDHTLVAL